MPQPWSIREQLLLEMIADLCCSYDTGFTGMQIGRVVRSWRHPARFQRKVQEARRRVPGSVPGRAMCETEEKLKVQ